MKKRILITGGAGYIGSNLADSLLADGNRVSIVDDLSTGKIDNIRHQLDNPLFDFYRGTISDEKHMEKYVRNADLIYHLAAAVGVRNIVREPLKGILTNVEGTEVVLRLSHKFNKRILIASTSEIYGKNPAVPFSEDDDRVLGPTSIHRWSYSTAKALDEHLAYAYHDQGLQVSIVRYFNSYGPRVDEKGYGSVVAQFIRQALMGEPITVHGSGRQTRCFTFIKDTLNGTIKAATKNEAIGRVYNIGNNKEIKIIELARMIKKLTGSRSEIVFIKPEKYYGRGYEDTLRRKPEITRARKELGFVPAYGLGEGLKLTIEWCRENYKSC